MLSEFAQAKRPAGLSEFMRIKAHLDSLRPGEVSEIPF
jgi:hypothetical protein